jgi:hypothetical protein
MATPLNRTNAPIGDRSVSPDDGRWITTTQPIVPLRASISKIRRRRRPGYEMLKRDNR